MNIKPHISAFCLALSVILISTSLLNCSKSKNLTQDSTQAQVAEQEIERDANGADKRAMRARYQAASDNMLKMVEAGEITREQMQTRLDGMRERMRK